MNVRERQCLQSATSELNAMQPGSDAEIEHGRAEEILCDLLTELGFEDASKAFNDARERVGFWYA